MAPGLDRLAREGVVPDAKSQIQELVQRSGGMPPTYRVVREGGPDHAKHFLVEALVGDCVVGRGDGSRKADAEQAAARDALRRMESTPWRRASVAAPHADRGRTQRGLRRSREAWFSRLAGIFQRPRVAPDLWDEAEELLLGADVGVHTAMALLDRLRARSEETRTGDLLALLKEEICALLELPGEHTPAVAPAPPHVVMVVGVNGAGKTTSIAKLAARYRADGKRVVLAAGDTFRAAAIEQLQFWGERVGADVVAHRQGADPGAVAHDAFQAARARGADVLIVDTAGRLHTKSHLMEGDGQGPAGPVEAGSHCAPRGHPGARRHHGPERPRPGTGLHHVPRLPRHRPGEARRYSQGGILLAIADQLRLPVLYVGTGEGVDDLAAFDAREFVDALLSPALEMAGS